MAIQTLDTIKQWFRTTLKPTQSQFWDTWDSFRHKDEKVPVKDVENLDELLDSKTDKSNFKTINGESILGEGNLSLGIGDLIGTPNTLPKFSSSGSGLENSLISDDSEKISINQQLEIDSKISGTSGLKFANLKNDGIIREPVDIPTGIKGYINRSAIDSKGNIYLYEEIGGTSIYKINSFTNEVTVVATLPSRVDGINVANSDNVYFTYYTSEGITETSIGRISPDGIVSEVILGINGYYSKMTLDAVTEDIYLTTYDKVIKVTSSGVVSEFIPSISIGTVNCMAVDSNHNLILALSNSSILKFRPNGERSILTTLNSPSSPRAIVIGKDNTIYTANYYSNDIAVISQSGHTNYIGNIGEYNAELTIDNDGNFLTVAHNARKLYLTTPEGVSKILGDTAEFPRLPVVNSQNEIFVPNYNGGLQKYIIPKNRLLTVDENGNVLFSEKEVVVKSDFKTINGESILGNGNIVIEGNEGSAVSATQSGFVDNTELQELGGADKMINRIRIGNGNGNFENNLVLGRNGLASVTTGQYNVGIGNGDGDVEGPLQYLTTGNNNTMTGSDAGINITTGSNNTGIGTGSLFNNTTANSNTAIGVFALNKNITSPFNVAIGSSSLGKMESGLGQSTAIGAFCMSDATSTDKNAAIGTFALRYNTSGFSNTAIGHTALGLNTSGNSNNAVGNYSLGAITTGAANIGVGKFAGRYITTGIGNIYIGSEGVAADAEASGIINIGNRFIAKGTKVSLIGNLNIGTAAVYENNTAALAGGLIAGDVYRTAAGVLMITF